MNLARSCKIALVALLAAQNFLAVAQTNSAAAPADYSTFSTFIAQRNIFDPNRVPNIPWVPRASRPVAYAPPPQPASFSLVGVIGYGDGKMAGAYVFFDGTSQQYRKTAQLNGSIANFKISDIAADSVTLVSGTNNPVVLKIGEQLHDDGNGHWLNASGDDVRYSTASSRYGNRNGNGSGGRRQRGNNSGGFNNRNFDAGNYSNSGFNRGRNNVDGTASGTVQTPDPNMIQDFNNAPGDNTPPDFNAPPDNAPPPNFIAPPDSNAPPDAGQPNK